MEIFHTKVQKYLKKKTRETKSITNHFWPLNEGESFHQRSMCLQHIQRHKGFEQDLKAKQKTREIRI